MDTPLQQFYRGKKVLVTGHTGFKGGWLSTWLKMLGAEVVGFSLPAAENRQGFFEAARVEEGMESVLGDIRDPASLLAAFEAHEPEIVFHMAALPLVRTSYVEPLDTYATNVMGTVHVLEAVRQTPSVRVAVVITSDKCYENRESDHAYCESDPMGGHDPYSASKGAAELVVASYRNSFFNPERLDEHGVSLASVRGGNVMGGGDWATDRLIPDCVRALAAGRSIEVRYPKAIRPWQHVLEPLAGYLWVGRCMGEEPSRFAEAWNFGPDAAGTESVSDIVAQAIEEWGDGEWEDVSGRGGDAPHEATILKLDCTKSQELLGWRPALTTRQCVQKTMAWYRRAHFDEDFDGHAFTLQQIEEYTDAASQAGISWAV